MEGGDFRLSNKLEDEKPLTAKELLSNPNQKTSLLKKLSVVCCFF